MINREYIDAFYSCESQTIDIEVEDEPERAWNQFNAACECLAKRVQKSTQQISAKQEIRSHLEQLKKLVQTLFCFLRNVQLPPDIVSCNQQINQRIQAIFGIFGTIDTPQALSLNQEETLKSLKEFRTNYQKLRDQRSRNLAQFLKINRERLSKNHQIRAKLRKGFQCSLEYYDRRMVDFRDQLNEYARKVKEYALSRSSQDYQNYPLPHRGMSQQFPRRISPDPQDRTTAKSAILGNEEALIQVMQQSSNREKQYMQQIFHAEVNEINY